MLKPQLRIIPESFALSRNGDVTGVIYFEAESSWFPDKRWNDFVIVILGWWLSALGSLHANNTDEVVLEFMDGPFRVVAARGSDKLLTVRFLRDPGASIQHECVVSEADLIASVVAAARSAHATCLDNGWVSDDIELLSQLINLAEPRHK